MTGAPLLTSKTGAPAALSAYVSSNTCYRVVGLGLTFSTSGKYGSGSAANPSSFPSLWPPSSGNWSSPAPDTPPSGTKERPNGSSPADGPADPSAEPTSLTAYANWGSRLDRLARPRCSASPPNSPPPLLARLLGIHISVAVAWQRTSAGDWTSYAADYSRRQHRSNEVAGSAHGVPS